MARYLVPASRAAVRGRHVLVLSVLLGASAGCGHTSSARTELEPQYAPVAAGPWAASRDLSLALESAGADSRPVTDAHRDFKPSWSKTGSMLTFFRLVTYGKEFYQWKSILEVVGTDGTGLRPLTDGRYADFNPTWTRDGTNQVIFNRYATGNDWFANSIYLASPSGSPGSEVLVSNPANGYEWAHSGLKDGRIFIDRVDFRGGLSRPSTRSFLLTPTPGGTGKYEELARPTEQLWHKLTVSPGETKVAYMLDGDWNMSTYEDVVLYYADFDPATRVVSNPVAITTLSPHCIHEYPAWSPDESMVIYDSNCSGVYQMYAYRLADKTTSRISTNRYVNYQFGCFENLPK
jgi:hypothetical protein